MENWYKKQLKPEFLLYKIQQIHFSGSFNAHLLYKVQ